MSLVSSSHFSLQAKQKSLKVVRLLVNTLSDGFQVPLDSTTDSYNTIGKLDPYHVVSLGFKCETYHLEEYITGWDIILTDPHPIGVNTTWSEQYL